MHSRKFQLSTPARLDVYVYTEGKPGVISMPSVRVQSVNFQVEDIDFTPIIQEILDLKSYINTLLDSKQLAQDIGNELVGESYLRWDTQVRFYPTIVFIFLESDEDFITNSFRENRKQKKKVQIKLRITSYDIQSLEQNTSLLETFVQNVKQEILLKAETLSFFTGNIRSTYVNQGNVSWKTTIFSYDVVESVQIMNKLYTILNQNMNPTFFLIPLLREEI